MRKRKITDESADELRHQSDDPAIWSGDSVPIEARPTRTSVLSLRLPTAEFHALLRAARSAHESVSEYVRKAIVMRRESQEAMHGAINVTLSYPGMETPDKVQRLQWTACSSGTAQGELELVRR